jgi:hypothetical protein
LLSSTTKIPLIIIFIIDCFCSLSSLAATGYDIFIVQGVLPLPNQSLEGSGKWISVTKPSSSTRHGSSSVVPNIGADVAASRATTALDDEARDLAAAIAASLNDTVDDLSPLDKTNLQNIVNDVDMPYDDKAHEDEGEQEGDEEEDDDYDDDDDDDDAELQAALLLSQQTSSVATNNDDR